MNPVIRGFKSLTDFNGRDRRGQFWPYAGVVALVFFMLEGLGLNLAMFTALEGGSELTFILAFMTIMVAGLAILLVLLAAAVSRRLHDVGHSGRWALIPLAAMACSLVGFGVIILSFFHGDAVDEAHFNADVGPTFVVGFIIMGLSNLAYMGSLLTLVVFLCLNGKTGPNRYGPEPV